MSWFRWLLTGRPDFVTRDCCGEWTEGLILAYRVSNWAIALAYFAIPLALYWLYRRRKEALPKPWMLLCFCSFIVLCGATHALDALAFAWPAYRLFTLVDALTASVSLATACLLPSVVRHLATLPSPEEYAESRRVLELQALALEDAHRQLSSKYTHARREMGELRRQVMAAEGKVLDYERVLKIRQSLHNISDALLKRDPPEGQP